MSVSLEVSKREVRPRSLRNKLRHEGKVPAVIYGYKIESTPISFDGLTLSKLLREHGANTVITMDIDGQKVNTLVHKIQTNTFTNHFEHAEFLSVNMSEETEVVSATPDKLPERIEVDVTNLELGDSITVADLPKNDDYKFVTDSEEQIAAVVAQSEEEESTSEGGEPEVIGSKEE